MRAPAAVALLLACWLLAGCRREDREYRSSPPFGGGVRYYADYENNAYVLTEGKRLFQAMNCVGCHAHGGGGMGPPLMDEKWLYGFEPEEIFDTISGGRPGGMPAFGGAAREPGIKVVGELPEHQRWQLVAYVRSMSGLAPSNAAPSRDDHMNARPPENSTNNPPPEMVKPPPDVLEPKK